MVPFKEAATWLAVLLLAATAVTAYPDQGKWDFVLNQVFINKHVSSLCHRLNCINCIGPWPCVYRKCFDNIKILTHYCFGYDFIVQWHCLRSKIYVCRCRDLCAKWVSNNLNTNFHPNNVFIPLVTCTSQSEQTNVQITWTLAQSLCWPNRPTFVSRCSKFRFQTNLI